MTPEVVPLWVTILTSAGIAALTSGVVTLLGQYFQRQHERTLHEREWRRQHLREERSRFEAAYLRHVFAFQALAERLAMKMPSEEQLREFHDSGQVLILIAPDELRGAVNLMVTLP